MNSDVMEAIFQRVYSPRTKAARKYPHARLWQALGLSGVQVALALERSRGKGHGVTHQRLYQLLETGSADDKVRVLVAIKDAALSEGREAHEVEAAIELFVPEEAAAAGRKSELRDRIEITRQREALSRDVRLALLSQKPKIVEFEREIRLLMRRLEIPMNSKEIGPR